MNSAWMDQHASTIPPGQQQDLSQDTAPRRRPSVRNHKLLLSLLLIALLCLSVNASPVVQRRAPPIGAAAVAAPHSLRDEIMHFSGSVSLQKHLQKFPEPSKTFPAGLFVQGAGPIMLQAATIEEPLYGLVKRLLPAAYHSHFIFTLDSTLIPGSSANIHDTFRISNSGGSSVGSKVHIEGATMAGLGAGLNHYLRKVCEVELTWSGDRLQDLPAIPPTVKETKGVIRASFVPWRYYMNVVTFGYSFAFWDWTRWERELDWMMLSGVNMCLAMVGQEYIFRQMYENLGLTREQLNGFFGGPAYMPWQRMGNLQGSWEFDDDESLKNEWIDSQWDLQGQIMGRMRDFNITPILPSFNGFVPRDLPTKFPWVKFDHASVWGSLPHPHSRVTFVPSTEPLFFNLTREFIQLQTSLYEAKGLGSHAERTHYLLDLYNELDPVCTEVKCLRQIAKNVMKALKRADPKAIWTMQAWFMLRDGFWTPERIKAFFDGIREVNEGKSAFVIDLYSDVSPLWNSTEGFFGVDWGWSMLNNFGGGQALYGTLSTLLTEPFKGYQHPAKKMRGMGITMEGINNNEYLYQLIFDLAWESVEANAPSGKYPSSNLIGQELDQTVLDGQKHLEAFFKRRYGPQHTTPAMIEAWTTLSHTVWDIQNGQMSQSRAILDITPSLHMERIGFMATVFWYNQTLVVEAWTKFVGSTETEASRQRRGYGFIQNSVAKVLRVASGKLNASTVRLTSEEEQGEEEEEEEEIGVASRTTLLVSFSRKAKNVATKVIGLTSAATGFKPDMIKFYHTWTWASSKFAVVKYGGYSPSAQEIVFPTFTTTTAALPNASDLPLNVSSFRYDLVDITREIMVVVVIPGLHLELVEAYEAKDLETTTSFGNLLLEAILDTDRILATHSHFMLGPWIRDARASARVMNDSSKIATDPLERSRYANYLEHQARSQITWWAPHGQVPLSNYAAKEWAGLVKDFYYPRWEIFVNHLVRSVRSGHELNYALYLEDSLKKETEWQKQTMCLGGGCAPGEEAGKNDKVKDLPVEAVEDTVVVAQDLWDRWATVAMRLAQKAERRRRETEKIRGSAYQN